MPANLQGPAPLTSSNIMRPVLPGGLRRMITGLSSRSPPHYVTTFPFPRTGRLCCHGQVKSARITLACLGLLPLLEAGFAQGTKADYQRALALREHSKGKLLKGWVEARWHPDGSSFWYQNKLAGGESEFVVVESATGRKRVVADGAKLIAALEQALGRAFKDDEQPLEALELENENTILVRAAGKSFGYRTDAGELTPREAGLAKSLPGSKLDGVRQRFVRSNHSSPDRRWQIEVRKGDLFAKPGEGENEIRFTTDAKLERVNIFWSPDSKRFVAFHRIPGEDHIVHVVESSPADQVQPKLKSWRYTKPGDKIAQTRVKLFDLELKKEILLDDQLFPNPWSINSLRWAEDSSRFTFLYNQRGHQVMRIVAVDAQSGVASSLIEDTPDTFFNYFAKLFHYYLDQRSEIIWMSERDGWNHLYLFDAQNGNLKNQITKGEWIVRGVDRIDAENETIWFRACGMNPKEDPYHVHFCRINFDGTGLVRMTAGDGTHNIRYSPDRKHFIDNFSRIDLPPVHELRRAEDGSLVTKLEDADISHLESIPGWSMPERFVAKGRDGVTDIWGVIHRPSNFDPSKKYPIVEKIYAGPHGNYVPKRFYEFLTAMDIAEVGCIVVVIDGMGTNWRSKAFHDVCWQNLADAGFPDRILWMQAAANKYPSIDLERVGIYGGSAGGQNALGGLLFHPDFYKVAVADCGCHDNRMDKIHWNEAWMGLMGPHYAENSNVTHAHKLQGKLFLTVAELDTNVDPASTMQVVNALIKADKDFDLAIVPGAKHGVGEIPYLRRRRQDFFVRHLLGVEPRER